MKSKQTHTWLFRITAPSLIFTQSHLQLVTFHTKHIHYPSSLKETHRYPTPTAQPQPTTQAHDTNSVTYHLWPFSSRQTGAAHQPGKLKFTT